MRPSKTELLQGCGGLGSLAGKAEIVQGWGARPSKAEILQGCASLEGAWPGGDDKCLWIPGLRACPTEILQV
jgi:hypothetical protein